MLLRESKVASYFREDESIFDGFAIYGDPAYRVNQYIITGFKGARLSERQVLLNRTMTSVRESVE